MSFSLFFLRYDVVAQDDPVELESCAAGVETVSGKKPLRLYRSLENDIYRLKLEEDACFAHLQKLKLL